MMYKNQLAFAIKVNDKIVKENKDTTLIPFGSEYSLFFKNLNSRRAIVHITIDDTPVNEGGFVVYGNSTLDIERFVNDNEKGNRFKFIERTGSIEEHRGIKIDDGLIRVEYQFEKEILPVLSWNQSVINTDQVYVKDVGYTSHSILRSRSMSNVDSSPQVSTLSASNSTADVSNVMYMDAEDADVGITVPGSISEQKFTTVSSFPLESEKHVMVMHILGKTATNEPVKEAVPSRRKQKCVTCGRVNKANAKFCVNCGTSLEVI